MAQDPWDNVPVVTPPQSRPQAGAQPAPARGGRLTRYRPGDPFPVSQAQGLADDGALSPEDFQQLGFVQENGEWVRPENTAPVAAARAAPWEEIPVVTPKEIEERTVVDAGAASSAFNAPWNNAFLRGALEQGPGFDEAAAGIGALLTGQSYGDVRRAQGMVADYDRENNTAQRNLGGIAGFSAGFVAPGSQYVSGARGLQGAIRSAQVGGAYGAAYGLGSGEGGIADRLPRAGGGAAAGAIGGAALQGGAQVLRPYADRLGSIASGVVRPFNRNVAPEVRAAESIAGTITDPAAAAAERARLQALGLDPSLMDVTGGTTERLVRTAAGPAGPAAESAVANMAARQANLKPEAMAVTRGLSPDPRTATQIQEGLAATRGTLADQQYAPAYAARVTVDEATLRALSDEPGRAALRRARAAAVARQNNEQVAEIDQLLSGQATEVAAGTLDRVRIAMQGRAQAMQQRPDTRDIASGLFGRAGQIDDALEAVPGLAPARETYRNLSGAIEAIDNAGQVFNTDPQEFAQIVQRLTPEQRDAMIIGVRQEIMDTLGGQRAAGTGSLQTISEAPYARQNLEALLGPEEAARYIGSIQARVQQAQRAARVSPNTNSQTYGRAADEAGFNPVEVLSAALDGAQALGNPMAAARSAGRLQNLGARLSMSPEVRQSIVDLGLGSADELERVLELAATARSAGRPPPREVRAYVTRARNVLGAQSPVSARLEQLLLPAPARVAAEEEQPR